MNKGEERGGPPIVGEPRDGLRFGGRREPRKCRDLAGRQAVDLRKVISNLANLGQTDERAADQPDRLYPAGDGALEFRRIASRLLEMQSPDYLSLAHLP